MGSPAVTANLNSGPPLPPHLQPQSSSLSGLAGSGGGEQPGGGASLQANVVQKLMFAEKALRDAASIQPAIAGAVDGIVNDMRQRLGKILQQAAQQGPPEAQGGQPAPSSPAAMTANGG